MSYAAFLESKKRVHHGEAVQSPNLPRQLFDWQAAIARWALRKGRSAIFADCGLGKTFMQIAWALNIPGRVLILAPLCVAEQTVREAAKLGARITYAPDGDHAKGDLVITNYERLDRFDADDFAGVVLDESSILKAFDGKTRAKLIATFAQTPYRLCCTATPSPNDIAELANHAEFLGLMTRAEFLATWFVHDEDGWRMKKHAVQPFFRWLASWAVALRKPSDIGFADEGFELPALRIHENTVESDEVPTALFPELGVKGIHGRMASRRASLSQRLEAAVALTETPGQWLLWCGLNPEADALAEQIADAVNVQGSDSYAEKVSAIESFTAGETRVLVTKPKVAGFGLNFQNCHQMAFVGLSDSYEAYYQCIRRCWRFGQKEPVDAYVVVSRAERLIVENVRQKESHADALSLALLANMRDFEREELIA